ncbi:metal-dependent hydrolase [Haloarcula laminariae]|uniref:metal-dependent hydrolase n=1 Tax=Haloarcula laminariae TaxID=2961577 RepID=UPI002404A357|nr:metal-dependent hydrolase [Halomicroarcula sp. FL173]
MVDVLGHLGMALLWLAPVWYFIGHRRTAALVIGGGFWFGMLPDIDLPLSAWVDGIHHHGVVHTVLAVAIFAAVIGPLLGLVFARIGTRTDSKWFYAPARERATAIGVLTVLVTGLAHLFADILSAPDVSTRIEPLWPVVEGPIVMVDVLWYQSWWATWGLFVLGVAVNGLAWYLTDGRDEPPAGTPVK